MKKIIHIFMILLGVFGISFIMIACDGLDIKNVINDIKDQTKEETTLEPLSDVVIKNVKNESSIQISWKASKEVEEVVIKAIPVSGGNSTEVVVSKSEYQKFGQKYVLKRLKEKTEYEIKVTAKAGKKEMSEKKQKVSVPKDTTAPKDRLGSIQISRAGDIVYLVWNKESVEANNTDISVVIARIYDILAGTYQDIEITNFSKGKEDIKLDVLDIREYKVELRYRDANKNEIVVEVGANFIPSLLKERIQSIQISKQELIRTIQQAIIPITITKNPTTATGIFSISPDITQATGLSFNTITGEITGTPTKENNRQTYTILFTGDGSYEGTATATLEVQVQIGSDSLGKYQYSPSTKDELQKIIELEIQKQGNNANLNIIDTRLITDMSDLFKNDNTFNGDITNWNTSNVKNMSGMFISATAFNQDIGNWDVGNVTDMKNMFAGTNMFNQYIGSWDTSNVLDMSGMFAVSVFNQGIGTWDVSNVTNMAAMFSYTSEFNQDIGHWDMGNVTEMNLMFTFASEFNQNLSTWKICNYDADEEVVFLGSNLYGKPDWQPLYRSSSACFVS